MPMSFDGHVASSSGCAIKPKEQEIGSTGYAGHGPIFSPIGSYAMATAEHREPCDSRGSCTVLGAPGGEIPPGDSTTASRAKPRAWARKSATSRNRTYAAEAADVGYVPIVLKKSPTGRCGDEICNKRIEASRFLNRCCVSGPDLESIFRARRRK